MLQEGHVELGRGNDFDGLSSGFKVVAVLFDAVTLTLVKLVDVAALECFNSSIPLLLLSFPLLPLPSFPLFSLFLLLSLLSGYRHLSL